MSIRTQLIDGKTFGEAFADAERQLKRFERVGGKTLEPSINQLRYASRHYLEAEKEENEAAALEILKKAIAHCRRAQYDAIEAAIAVVGKNIVEYTEKYLHSSVLIVIPDYPEKFAKAVSLLESLRVSDAPRNIAKSEIDVYGDKLEQIVAIWNDLLLKRPLVDKLDQERRTADRISMRRHIQNVLLTVLGIVTAVAIAVLGKVL